VNNRFNIVSIAALIAAIAFSATAAYGQQIVGADNLVLSGQMHTPITENWDTWAVPFEGSIAVVSELDFTPLGAHS